MKRFTVWVLPVCLLLMVQTGLGAFAEKDGMIVMEAEHYDALDADNASPFVMWELRTDEPAVTSNSEFMACPANSADARYDNLPDVLPDIAPRMDYECEFTTGGTYYVWVRAQDLSPATAGNSLHIAVDFSAAGNPMNVGIEWPGSGTGWHWTNDRRGSEVAASFEASAGVHTVSIYQREHLAGVDKIILTTDSGYVPEEPFGPDETSGETGKAHSP